MRPPIGTVLALLAAVGSLVGCTSDRPPAGAQTVATTTTTTVTPTTPAPTEPPVRTIAIVGDSITNGSETVLREQLAELDVEIQAIDAEDGRRMVSDGMGGSGLQAVTTLAAVQQPDLWIIALGTNDVGQLQGAASYAPVIQELMAAVPADTPLVWVNVFVESIPEASAEFNATLSAALEERGQAAVVDWAGLADEDGVLRDGIHPSGYGNDRFAELVAAAVSEWT